MREAGGKFVSGLKLEEFQAFDKGKRQKISSFSVETTEKPGENGAAALTKKIAGAEAPVEAGAGVVHASAMAQRFVRSKAHSAGRPSVSRLRASFV